jgi:membrane-associated phospholipid phosphatase
MGGATFGQASRGKAQPATGPLLPAAARPLAIAIASLCALVTAVQALWLRHGMETGWLDGAVDARVRAALGGHRGLLTVLVWPGEPLPVTALASALALASIVRRRYREAALVAISVPLATALTEFALKPLIGRTPWGDPFPSGHVTSVTALAVAAVTVLVIRMPATVPRALRPAAVCAAFLTAAAVAIGVIGSNMHHFSDTVGGAAVGTGTALLTALALDLLYGWCTRRREVQERVELPHGKAGISRRVLRRR